MPDVLDGVISSSQICSRSAALHPLAREPSAAREAPGEPIPEDRVELSEAAGERNHGQEARPNRHLLVERLRQSIGAGNYLTPMTIGGTVERLYRELFGP